MLAKANCWLRVNTHLVGWLSAPVAFVAFAGLVVTALLVSTEPLHDVVAAGIPLWTAGLTGCLFFMAGFWLAVRFGRLRRPPAPRAVADVPLGDLTVGDVEYLENLGFRLFEDAEVGLGENPPLSESDEIRWVWQPQTSYLGRTFPRPECRRHLGLEIIGPDLLGDYGPIDLSPDFGPSIIGRQRPWDPRCPGPTAAEAHAVDVSEQAFPQQAGQAQARIESEIRRRRSKS